MTTLKLGTRRSMLAWAQSSWVARELERLNPGLTVELVGIETQGDRNQALGDVPLQSIAGKEFFVAELDHSLARAETDLSVHSMKDLSLDRPASFALGAVPVRENPRDAVLFGPRALARLQQGHPLRVGTSSPRRLENIPAFLEKALPGGHARLELKEIRGNVNTRLSRVHEPDESPRALDAVVLAFAGLIRLYNDDAGQKELDRLLEGVRWMILPLRECPAAPAQGALAVECRADDAHARAALAKLHDERTARACSRERQLLADWGGGCHQRFGATAAGDALYIRGAKADGTFVDECRFTAPPRPAGKLVPWDGSKWRGSAIMPLPQAMQIGLPRSPAHFVAHARAWPAGGESGGRVWTSGTASWLELARLGVWVEGCAEGLGFEALRATLAERVLRLPALTDWTVLTHEGALSGWQGPRAVATYRLDPTAYGDDARRALGAATDVFWSSGSQFDELRSLCRPDARHACGAGKTAVRLRAAAIEPTVFPSAQEWRTWLNL